ncbi:hypothetical protein IWW55_000026 [Coemansia sp. RSA 2706]|nr:hypothetical protein IWW55_000026 [Coemansia sp. RSA 2706]
MDAPQETQDDEMVRARIVALLPDIAHIGVYSSASTDLSGSVSQLVNAYVDRLHSLAVSQPFELSFPRFGPQLRNLAISGCPEQRNSLPLVSAQSIETLDIGCMFNQLVWEEYVYGLNSNIMTFANLRELKLCILGVSDIQPLGRPPIHVLFPALKRLELDSGHRTYEIFGNAAINPNLRQLHVSGSLLALHALCRVGITSVNHLEVYVYRDQAAGEKVLVDTLNYFFGTVRSYRTSTLNLRAYAFDLGRHEIRWTYLQVLELNAPLVFSSLYWLIPRMPRLRSLDLMNVQVDRHSLMLLDSENRGADTTRPRPLSQTIYILQINRHRQDPPDMVYAVKSLVLQLPALQTIGLSPSITPAVEQLFDDELIPHGYFKSIEFM